VYRGARVRGVATFGVFVDLGRGQSGLVHASELAPPRPRDPATRYAVGDEVDVVVLGVSDDGKVSLSERQAPAEGEGDSDDEWEEEGAPATPGREEAARPGRE
jgi:S1 RNA binding domain protein